MAITVAELNAVLKADTKDFESGMKRASGDAEGFGSKLKSATGTVAKVGSAVTVGFGTKAVSAASDLNESVSKVDTVFGSSAGTIQAWSKTTASSFGISRNEALSAAGSFGNMFTQLGVGAKQAATMSTGIVELAADFASFHNADISEVLTAQQAAFRGEYDSLQKFLPLINAASVEQKALAMTGKKNKDELTAQDKALAVNALMMEGAGDAAGDFHRTQGGLANQMRILKAQAIDFAGNVGGVLIPVLLKGIDGFKKAGAWVGRLGDAFKEGGLAGAISFIADEWGKAWPKIEAALGSLLSSFGSWITDTAWPYLKEKVPVWAQAFWQWIQDVTPPALKALGEFLTALGSWIQDVGFPFLQEHVPVWVEAMWKWIQDVTPPALKALAALLGDIVGWLIDDGLPWLAKTLVDLGKALWHWIQDVTPQALGQLVDWMAQIGSWILNDGIPKLVGFLANMGVKLISWIADVFPQIPGKLGEFVGKIGAWIVTDGIPALLGFGIGMSVAVLDFLVTAAKDAPGKIADVISAIAGWLKDKGPGLLKDGADLLVGALTAPFKFAFNLVAGFWNDTIGSTSFHVPDWVPGIGGKGFDFPDMPIAKALGGAVWPGQDFLVGEKGPEIVRFGQSGTVIPNNRIGMAGGGGGGITINVTAGVGDPVEIGRQVQAVLLQLQRRTGSLGFN